MKTRAVRLYGKNDLRLEEFELPAIRDDEILARVVSDSICMSSYKAAIQGPDHKRVPNDVATNPIIIGHEFCGVLVEVGAKWQDKFHVGQRYTIQPALNYLGRLGTPGYAYPYCGGSATYVILPQEVMLMNCLLPFDGDAFFLGSLAEPMSCIIGGYHANYHSAPGVYAHDMGIRKGGNVAILAGCGPMGLGAIDYALHGDIKPARVVVTDIDEARLARAAAIVTVEEAKRQGIELIYLNTSGPDAVDLLMAQTGGEGYDDVFVYAPVKPVVEQADKVLRRDGCLNFFAGPSDPSFSANFNFYNVHYMQTHVVGTSGGNTDDMNEALAMMAAGTINPAGMVTHVGGLDSVVETTLNLPKIPGGKKLVYTGIDMPLTALDDLAAKAAQDPLCAKLAPIVERHGGLWSAEAEKVLLEAFGVEV